MASLRKGGKTMDNVNSSLLYMLITFCLGALIIWRRESLPERIRRPLAIFSLLMVSVSFIMFVVSLYKMN